MARMARGKELWGTFRKTWVSLVGGKDVGIVCAIRDLVKESRHRIHIRAIVWAEQATV